MSSRAMPNLIKPFELAQSRGGFEGSIPIAGMKRLAELLRSTEGVVQAAMSFGIDESGQPYVAGSVSGSFVLQCQRCMGDYLWPVQIEFTLGLVRNEQDVDGLSERYEPLLVPEGELMPLSDIIEDELLLAVPIAVLHPEAECPVANPYRHEPGRDAVAEPVKKPNPFAVLAGLKDRQ